MVQKAGQRPAFQAHPVVAKDAPRWRFDIAQAVQSEQPHAKALEAGRSVRTSCNAAAVCQASAAKALTF